MLALYIYKFLVLLRVCVRARVCGLNAPHLCTLLDSIIVYVSLWGAV